MQVSQSTLILGAVVLAAGAFALGRESAPSDTRIIEVQRPDSPGDPGEPQAAEPAVPGVPGATELPAGHVPIPGAGGGMGGGMGAGELAADTEPAAIEWTIPTAWHTMPNPSAMRLATYSVPHAPTDSVDADVSVSRAGGDVSANIERWTGQFAGAEQPKPVVRTVHGFEVTVVELEGIYTSGMGPGGKAQPGWALLAAIVKTPGMPYFFKMTGPAATVHAARAPFTAMIDGIHGPG